MLDSIYIGMSGLAAHSRNLRTIASNTANLDTPGFKASSTEFSTLVEAGGAGSGSWQAGLNATGQRFDLAAGTLRASGSALDAAIDGAGFFVLRRAGSSELQFTRDGRFALDGDGWFIHSASGARVMTLGAGAELEALRIDDLRLSESTPTGVVTFSGLGYLDDDADPDSGQKSRLTFNEEYVDLAGTLRSLRIEITQRDSPGSGTETLDIKAFEGEAELGSSTLLVQADGHVVADQPDPEFTIRRPGLDAQTIRLDFRGDDVRLHTSTTGSGSLTAAPDGQVRGELINSALRFDAEGRLVLSYTNGQSTPGPRLVLADTNRPGALRSSTGGVFESGEPSSWRYGGAGQDGLGVIAGSRVEASNVDLSAQFSDLVIAQRGYQASSQILGAANEMLQQLLSMRGR